MNGQCERVGRLIIDYVLGELDRSEMELVRQHLRPCARCTKAVEDVEQIVSALSRQEMAEPCAAVCDSVREAVREKVLARRRPFSAAATLAGLFTRRPLLVGASALVVIAVVVLLVVVPALRPPEELSRRLTAAGPAKGTPEARQNHSAITVVLKVPRKFADYLSESHKVMTLLGGGDAREVLAASEPEWDRWFAEADVMQDDKSLEAYWPLLADLESLYKAIMECNGEFEEEQIRRIRQLISEMNLTERTKEVLDSRK